MRAALHCAWNVAGYSEAGLSVMRRVVSSTLASHRFVPPSAALSSVDPSGCSGASGRAVDTDKQRRDEDEDGVLAVASERGEDGADGGASEGGVDGDGGLE